MASARSFSAEQEIERDRGGPGAFQRVDKRGKTLARPRPLPEPLERFFVDRDNADGLVERVRARLPALVLVEHQILHHGARRRADDACEQRQRASRRRGQCVKSGFVRPSHAVLAARRLLKIEETPALSSQCARLGRPSAKLAGSCAGISADCLTAVRMIRPCLGQAALGKFLRSRRARAAEKAFDAEVDRDPVGLMSGIDAVAAQKGVKGAGAEVDWRCVPDSDRADDPDAAGSEG